MVKSSSAETREFSVVGTSYAPVEYQAFEGAWEWGFLFPPFFSPKQHDTQRTRDTVENTTGTYENLTAEY